PPTSTLFPYTTLFRSSNIDLKTVEGFGDEWSAYDQKDLPLAEHRKLFNEYFSIFPFERLPDAAEGFDLGCGTGRWAELVADRVRSEEHTSELQSRRDL